ncbi:hydroxyacylglutathione hydrolase [Stenoxybacter acetivorans]|uniref:hydroxyacylglutathione hydrolase n=1 Tax=Stenoxybacter acetivorans TaxID=422441 RepID=UPI00056C8B6B|nr:hydroxyacylglutathione hydrolase [Stenoxybacter acetivorans]
MKITPIAALSDNYIWLLIFENNAVCVDPGDAEPILRFLSDNHLNLMGILLTHHHHDHIGGVAALKARYPQCTVYGNAAWGADCVVGEGDVIHAGECTAEVWLIPGHTAAHLAYLVCDHAQTHVFCGDTLFSAGCGRVFDGTVNDLFNSLQRFNRLPENTLFYPAHEYTLSNLRFSQAIEPENTAVTAAFQAAQIMRHHNKPTLPTSLAHERQINPFLRIGKTTVKQQAVIQGLPESEADNESAVFAFLREWKNRF